ncbi:MAG: hypothetical protein K2N63_11240 [Lachnospiraceae bacterium]|nr:hypothetical protein [Lachnospiraceae bacterium]
MKQYNSFIKSFSIMLLGILLITGCGKNKEGNVMQLGSTCFGDYAVAVSGKDVIYTKNADQFSIQTSAFPVESNYCAIYDDKLYYTDAKIGYENGEVEGGNCTILCCNLDGKGAEKILELQDASYLNAYIQEGILYCIWETSEGEAKEVVVILSSGEIMEIETGRAVRAVNKTGYYFEEENQIYYCPYKDSEKTLFCESKGEVISLYFNGENLCVLSEKENTTDLSVYNADGTCIKNYENLETIEESRGKFINMVKSEGDILYYELAGDKMDGSNCNLIRLDLDSGTKEICGTWYIP